MVSTRRSPGRSVTAARGRSNGVSPNRSDHKTKRRSGSSTEERHVEPSARRQLAPPTEETAPPPREAATDPRSDPTLLSLWDFFDLSKPWVLVLDGNARGYFDFVPIGLRVGPWQPSAFAYLTFLVYGSLLGGLWLSRQQPEAGGPVLSHPPVGSYPYYYNLLATLWMGFVIRVLWKGPAGPKAWATYTVQSWTLLMVRHGLSAAASHDTRWASYAELVRFPALCSATITCAVWNGAIMPFIYYHKATPEERRSFLKFCFNFRLVQIHVFNMVFCVVNNVWASPKRVLTLWDFYYAILSMLVYLVWYLGILDRLGIHIYPIFSPRTSWAVVSYTLILVAYVATYRMWQYVLWPDPIEQTVESIATCESTSGTWWSMGRTALSYVVPVEHLWDEC